MNWKEPSEYTNSWDPGQSTRPHDLTRALLLVLIVIEPVDNEK